MAYIYRRGKYWWVGYDEGGRPVQKSLKVTSKAAATLLLAEYQLVEARHHNRSKTLSAKKGLAEIVSEFTDTKKRGKTRDWYNWCGEVFMGFCREKGIEDLRDVDMDMVEEFCRLRRRDGEAREEKRLEKGGGGRLKCDPGGASSILRGIKAIFSYAVKKHYISENPARHVKPDKPVRKLFRDLSFMEMERLLAAALVHSPAFYAMYATAYYAGLREGELIYLKPGDVDMEQCFLDVRSKAENLIKDHQERRIPLNARLRDILKGHTPGVKWMFETAPGMPRRNNLNRELRRVAGKAGIDSSTLNMRVLRETFGSHLRRRGVDIALISQYMGHSSIDVTLRHYAHIPIEQTHKEIDLL